MLFIWRDKVRVF